MNEPQIRKDYEIFKETQFLNGPQILKVPQI
jgi:hypothetical protein